MLKNELKKYGALILSLLLVACTTQTVAPTIEDIPVSNPGVAATTEPDATTNEIENSLPEFTKLPEVIELEKGSTLEDVLKLVEAKAVDGSVLDVKVEGDIDFGKPGDYKVKLIAEDATGIKVEKEVTIKVKESSASTNDTKDNKKDGNTVQGTIGNRTINTNNVPTEYSWNNPQEVAYVAPVAAQPSKPTTPSKPRDSKAPVITASDITIDFAHKASFDNITASDETDGIVLVTFVGDYNNRKAGVYPMTAIAKDKAGNTSKVAFNVIVNAHPRQGELDEAQGVVDETGKVLANANEALQAAKDKLDSLKAEHDRLEKVQTDAENDLASKKDNLRKLEGELEQANKDLEDAQKAYKDAVEFSTSSPEFKAAKEDLDAKTAALEEALKDETAASETLDEAKSAHELAVLKKDVTSKVVEEKEAKKQETEQAVADAKAALDQAKEDAANAVANKEEAAIALQNAEAAYNEAVSARQTAESDLANAKKAEETAAQRLADTQQAVLDAEAKVAEAQAVIDQGSYGYFAYHNNQGAMDVIDLVLAYQDAEGTTMTENMRTNLGDKKDATGLNNFEAAIEIIRRGNELRAQDDNFVSEGSQKPLLITDTMMAIAQVRANASSGYMNHWQYLRTQGYNVGENLAWAYDDPQRGWYTEEKLVYDWLQDNGYNVADIPNLPQEVLERCVKETGIPGVDWVQVGHYNNLMLEDYTVTGAATDGHYPTTSQEFAYSAYQKGILDKTYTVDEYLADFLQYKNKVEKDLNDAKTAKDSVQALLDELNANGGLTVAEKAAIDQATSALTTAQENEQTAQDKVASATSSLSTAENNVTEKNAVVEEKANVEKTAIAEDAQAGSELLDAKEEDVKATEDVKTTEKAVSDAEISLEDAKAAVETAKTELDEAQEVINTMNEAVAEAHDVVVNAQTNVETAEQNVEAGANEVKEATYAVEESVVATGEAYEAVVSQETIVTEAQADVVVAKEKHEEAVEVRDEIQADIDNTPDQD